VQLRKGVPPMSPGGTGWADQPAPAEPGTASPQGRGDARHGGLPRR
jgi:hypothetical protein